jgi:hypothetical protein
VVWILLPISIFLVSSTHHVVLSSAFLWTRPTSDGRRSFVNTGNNAQQLFKNFQLPGKKFPAARTNFMNMHKKIIEDPTTNHLPQRTHVSSKTSFVDSLLQTIASLLVNKTGMEQRIEFYLASRVRIMKVLLYF